MAFEKFKLSLHVRSDFASEHTLIRQHMKNAHLNMPWNLFLVGSFVHNQIVLYFLKLLSAWTFKHNVHISQNVSLLFFIFKKKFLTLALDC